MSRLTKMIRPQIATLRPYSSARDEFVLDPEQSGAASAITLLDANENSLGSVLDPSSELGEQYEAGLNRYPDPHQRAVKTLVADHLSSSRISVAPENIFLGNGSDEAIDLLFTTFCEPNRDAAVSLPPTYGMYRVSADIRSVQMYHLPLVGDFSIDEPAIFELQQREAAKLKLLFLCSPNNPTGQAVDPLQVARLLESFSGYVVVDEAYIDFCPEKSCLHLLNDYDNLIVLRTFSKAWGLAGIRLGAAIALPEVISVLNKVKAPYNISQLTQSAAIAALQKTRRMEEFAKEILVQREVLRTGLEQCPAVLQVYPSDANFLLVRFSDSARAFAALKDAGIIVRDRSSQPGCSNCLRITVGSKDENLALVAVVQRLESEEAC